MRQWLLKHQIIRLRWSSFSFNDQHSRQTEAEEHTCARFWNLVSVTGTIGNFVVIQRHCTIPRQGSTQPDVRASVQGDAGKRYDCAFKIRICAQSGGTSTDEIFIAKTFVGGINHLNN